LKNNHSYYIKRCKILIEEKLNWSLASKDWRQRDYLNLISALGNKTGILLSLSTVKRIWKDDYNGNPHPNTLDAFAKFLEYEDWLSFKKSENRSVQLPEPERIVKKTTRTPYKTILLVVSILLLAIIGFWYISQHLTDKNNVLSLPTEIPFSAVNTLPIGVPNTVIFKYDLSDVQADSFFIQQSWDPMKREKISKTDSILTSIYYYPGVHKAKLIANDSVIREIPITVYSGEWIATADYESTNRPPTYIPLNSIDGTQELKVKKELLSDYNLDIHDHLYLSYFYVNEFDNVSGDNFSLTMTLQVDSIADFTCPGFRIIIMGTEDIHAVNLNQKGCVHGAYTKFGEKLISGKNNDLSSFGTNVYKKQDLNIEIKEKKAKIYLNKENILETHYTKSIGDVVGFCFTFTGIGQINSVRLNQNSNETTIYQY
jgi:hypothetical protein